MSISAIVGPLVDLDFGTRCPKCDCAQMPPWSKDENSSETARACQTCGYVQERGARLPKPPVPKLSCFISNPSYVACCQGGDCKMDVGLNRHFVYSMTESPKYNVMTETRKVYCAACCPACREKRENETRSKQPA